MYSLHKYTKKLKFLKKIHVTYHPTSSQMLHESVLLPVQSAYFCHGMV